TIHFRRPCRLPSRRWIYRLVSRGHGIARGRVRDGSATDEGIAQLRVVMTRGIDRRLDSMVALNRNHPPCPRPLGRMATQTTPEGCRDYQPASDNVKRRLDSGMSVL